MPAIIDSAPDCVSSDPGTERGARRRTPADFVLGDPYQDCAGFMTFGPGSTYGPEGVGAETSYMVLTWIGIVVMVARPDRLGRVREPPPDQIRCRPRARRRHARRPQPLRHRRRSCYERKADRVPAEADARQVVRDARCWCSRSSAWSIVLIIVLRHRHRGRVPPDRLSWASSSRSVTQPPEPPAGRRRQEARGLCRAQGQLPDLAARRGCSPALLGVHLLRRQACQDNQIKVTQDQAVALAKKQVDFEPENTQIRLLRQGLDRQPFWIVSLSIPKGPEGPNPDSSPACRWSASTRPPARWRASRPRSPAEASRPDRRRTRTEGGPERPADAGPRPPAHRLRAPRGVLAR